MSNDFYDEDYYQRGIETGKSNYQNYRWIPELTIPMAMTIIDYLEIKRGDEILDYGCALGYLVKAFRLLGRNAFGVDISKYALKNVDHSVEKYCSSSPSEFHNRYDFCIAKDVFEHIEHKELRRIIDSQISANILFAVVPLGKRGKYIAPANNIDKSHIICEDLSWWTTFFKTSGLEIIKAEYEVRGIKDNYYLHYPKSHGFFTLGMSW